MSSKPALFCSIQVGDIQLKHRVVLAPSTNFRSTDDGVPTFIMAEYYSRRGSVSGTLLIAEATVIARKADWGLEESKDAFNPSPQRDFRSPTPSTPINRLSTCSFGLSGAPPIREYLAPGDLMFPLIPKRSTQPCIATPPHVPITSPRALRVEIKEYIQLFAAAASNAVHQAGFNGVEVHAANGYLPEQFLMDTVNERDDVYGGSIENRARFILEVVDAIVAAVGATKTAIRVNPWPNRKQHGFRMMDPKSQYGYLVKEIRVRHPNFSYIHIIEDYNPINPAAFPRPTISFATSGPLIGVGGYGEDPERWIRVAEERGDIIAYSQAFIANVGIPFPIFLAAWAMVPPLEAGDGAKYYTYGTSDPAGYIDYAFYFTSLNMEMIASA
ncbi:NADH:flavin oxidoreductase/NADH oxidase [Mycena venus]|uniref:NADH:flavin oxidoreductase/NADH oxidase n=1 Tax=Mycena venus TaxID=2733690 RepID=A0A8H6YER6_9AGAR|nr:NADH:flavin oxidoreductase/NADH oxidase [Mycena venus]